MENYKTLQMVNVPFKRLNMYKISIIVPVYNVENSLPYAFNSIYNQSIGFENIEIIFVNDSSTDSSGKLIDEYSEKYPNVKSIHLESNSGYAGKPRNVGIKNASAEYIMFLDPDDEFLEDACSLLYNNIENSNLEVVSGNYIHDGVLYKWNDINLIDNCLTLEYIDEEPEILKFTPAVWCKIFKKKFILENNILFPTDMPGQDLVFVFNSLLKAKGIRYINKAVVKYSPRLTGSNVSVTTNTNKQNLIGYIKAYNEICDLLTDNKQYIKYVLKHLNFWSKQLILSQINKSDKLDILIYANNLYQLFKETEGVRPNKILKPFFKELYNKKYISAINLCDSIAIDINFDIIRNKTIFIVIFEKDNFNNILKYVNFLKENHYTIKIINFKKDLQIDKIKSIVDIIDIFSFYDLKINEKSISLKLDDFNYTLNFDDPNDFYNYIITKICLQNHEKPFLVSFNNSKKINLKNIDENIAFKIDLNNNLKFKNLILNEPESIKPWDELFKEVYVNGMFDNEKVLLENERLLKENTKLKQKLNPYSSSENKLVNKFKNLFK